MKLLRSAGYEVLVTWFYRFPLAFGIGIMIGSFGLLLVPFIGTEWTEPWLDKLKV
jgi:hypothetical protein